MTARRLLRLAREALLLEIALYRALARWLVRRPDVPRGATALGYAQLVGPMLWLWIFGSAVEVVVVEVVLHQVDAAWADVVRLPLLVVGIWGVFWMLGMLASHRVRPHLLHPDRLLLRAPARTWAEVPLDAVTGTRLAEHELPGLIRSLHQDGDLLLVGVGSRTNLELVLAGPTTVRTHDGARTVDRVGLWVDDPRAEARRLREVVAAAGTAG